MSKLLRFLGKDQKGENKVRHAGNEYPLPVSVMNGGVDGESAYEIAVPNGFEGTEQEWLTSLKGEQGKTGPSGTDGVDGDQGPAGVDGTNGTDGVSVTGATSDGTNITFELSDGSTIDVPWPAQ